MMYINFTWLSLTKQNNPCYDKGIMKTTVAVNIKKVIDINPDFYIMYKK